MWCRYIGYRHSRWCTNLSSAASSICLIVIIQFGYRMCSDFFIWFCFHKKIFPLKNIASEMFVRPTNWTGKLVSSFQINFFEFGHFNWLVDLKKNYRLRSIQLIQKNIIRFASGIPEFSTCKFIKITCEGIKHTLLSGYEHKKKEKLKWYHNNL